MLRFGSVLLAGLLVLSGCGSDKSARGEEELRKACLLQAQYDQFIADGPNKVLEAIRTGGEAGWEKLVDEREKRMAVMETQMEILMTKSAKLDSDYEIYLGEWFKSGFEYKPKFNVKCAVLK